MGTSATSRSACSAVVNAARVVISSVAPSVSRAHVPACSSLVIQDACARNVERDHQRYHQLQHPNMSKGILSLMFTKCRTVSEGRSPTLFELDCCMYTNSNFAQDVIEHINL